MLTNEDLTRVRKIIREVVREEVDNLAMFVLKERQYEEYKACCDQQDRHEAHDTAIETN